MPTPKLAQELAEQAVAAVNEGLSKGYTKSRAIGAAAKSLRNSDGHPLSRQTLQSRLYAAARLYDIEPDWSLIKQSRS